MFNFVFNCHAVEEKKLDILINNAGATWIPERKTVDGFESIFATNYLGTTKHISVTVSVIRCVPKLATPHAGFILKFLDFNEISYTALS